ncbi:hypothetical protein VD0004_g574 [Verticillium dahliae]|nr:hypothetical protein VD0004_g574 [Verticillium dahliae]
MPPRVAAREEGGGGGLTVGWVLAIAIAGGALLFVSLAFILVTLTDRRNQRARLATESEARLQQDDDVSTETETQTKDGSFRPPRQRRRLTKSPQVSPRKTARRSLPHILPAIKHSGSLNIFGSPAGRKRKNSCNSWIDEDAIHGPKVVKAKRESKGFSLRESWLIMRTPTLPNLLGYRDEPETAIFYQHQNYPLVQQPRPAALSPQQQRPDAKKPTSRLPLVRTPSYEMAEKRAAALRAGFQKKQQQSQDEKEQEPVNPQSVPNGPRPPPKAKLRQVNTESDLQTILRNTAQRLNDGSPSPIRNDPRLNGNSTTGPNRATRHVRTPASRGSPVKSGTAWNERRSVAGEYRSTEIVPEQQTPSPKKRMAQPMTPQSAPAAMNPRTSAIAYGQSQQTAAQPDVYTPTHRRKQSTCSMASDQDSLYGETTPEQDAVMPAGLSSPDRRESQTSIGAMIAETSQQKSQQHKRSVSIPSMTSSVSSALSTLYSEEEDDETQTGEKIPWAHPVDPNQQRGSFKPRRIQHSPNMSDPFLVPPPAPQVPERSPRRLSASGEAQRPQMPEARSYQDHSRALGQISGNRRASNSSLIMAPLNAAQDGQLSNRDELRLSIMMEPSAQKQGQSSVRPKSVVTMKPKFFATSNSATSMMASPSTPEEDRKGHRRRRSVVIPPPLNLRPIQGSPHEKDAAEADDLELPTHNLHTRRSIIAAGGIPTEIPSSPVIARPLPDPTLLSKTPSPTRRRSQSTTPSRGPSNASSTYSNPGPSMSPTLILRPQTSINRGSPTHISPLGASIVQLRRMTPQVSAYSVASSAATAADDVADLCGGGFSPERSNSRAGRAGRQNYLSMGTPSPKSRNGIRSNRNSVKGRPASVAPKMNSLEEKENGESTVPVLTRGGLKGSLRTAESPKRRLSVRFAEVKEPIFVDALEMPEDDAEEVSRGRERTRTPTRNRASADSLGLYDKDGFLMSSPERFPSSVAEGRQGGALRI